MNQDDYERAFVNGQLRDINNLIHMLLNAHSNFINEPKLRTTGTLRSICSLCFQLGYECARLSILRSREMKG